MKVTTSTRISLHFTIFTSILVFSLGVVINVFFFINWYRTEQRNITAPPRSGKMMNKATEKKHLRDWFTNSIVIPSDDPRVKTLQETIVWKNISEIQEHRYMWKTTGNQTTIIWITPLVERQKKLLDITIFSVLGSAILSFIISKLFVKFALRDLRRLARYVQTLTVDTLDSNITLSDLPDHDEIAQVAVALNRTTSSLHEQVNRIKRFIDNASHELKTPLMALQSTVEVGLKTKTYQTTLEKTQKHISHLHELIEALLLLHTDNPVSNTHKEDVDLVDLTKHIIEQEQAISDKTLNITLDGVEKITISTHRGSISHIFSNLLHNASKFTPEKGSITIYISEDSWSIQDRGVGISKDDISRIRETFWQGDQSKGKDGGLGLGLSIVQKYTELLGYRIECASTLGQGTTFTLHFS